MGLHCLPDLLLLMIRLLLLVYVLILDKKYL